MLRERKLFLSCGDPYGGQTQSFQENKYNNNTAPPRGHAVNERDSKDSNLLFCEHTIGLLSPKYEAIEACLQLQQSTQ